MKAGALQVLGVARVIEIDRVRNMETLIGCSRRRCRERERQTQGDAPEDARSPSLGDWRAQGTGR